MKFSRLCRPGRRMRETSSRSYPAARVSDRTVPPTAKTALSRVPPLCRSSGTTRSHPDTAEENHVTGTSGGSDSPSARVSGFSALSTAPQSGSALRICVHMLAFAARYSAISVCQFRWLGERVVTAARSGERRMVINWKLDSSSTATSSAVISSTSGRSGVPMFPPRYIRPYPRLCR